MSATSPRIAYRRTTLAGRLGRAAHACPMPLRAFVLSRLIVIGAGVAGALAVPRRAGWTMFDPLRLSARLGSVGNVLAAPALRWDSIHYLAIAEHGYARASDTAFFPLYPLLIRALGYMLGSDPLAGVAISTVSFVVALALLHRLTELELGRSAADATVLLVALAPLSFFFTALYTESLFLALSLGAVYAARRERWPLAAFLGALATVTRVPGVLLVIPLAVMHLKTHRRPDRGVWWLLLMPGALAGLPRLSGREGVRGAGAADGADGRRAPAPVDGADRDDPRRAACRRRRAALARRRAGLPAHARWGVLVGRREHRAAGRARDRRARARRRVSAPAARLRRLRRVPRCSSASGAPSLGSRSSRWTATR